jgi:predicted nucleic acid-binding protein
VPVTFGEQICRDPDDDHVLGTAIAGNADYIVTGDRDLLVLERFQTVEIVSPSEFMDYVIGR